MGCPITPRACRIRHWRRNALASLAARWTKHPPLAVPSETEWNHAEFACRVCMKLRPFQGPVLRRAGRLVTTDKCGSKSHYKNGIGVCGFNPSNIERDGWILWWLWWKIDLIIQRHQQRIIRSVYVHAHIHTHKYT